jgi:hypothetical protein
LLAGAAGAFRHPRESLGAGRTELRLVRLQASHNTPLSGLHVCTERLLLGLACPEVTATAMAPRNASAAAPTTPARRRPTRLAHGPSDT